ARAAGDGYRRVWQIDCLRKLDDSTLNLCGAVARKCRYVTRRAGTDADSRRGKRSINRNVVAAVRLVSICADVAGIVLKSRRACCRSGSIQGQVSGVVTVRCPVSSEGQCSAAAGGCEGGKRKRRRYLTFEHRRNL